MSLEYTLYNARGCGGTVVEAVLELLKVPYHLHHVVWDQWDTWEVLRPHNPMLQVPTLVRSDGVVMSESAAIVQWLLDLNPRSRLRPPAGSPARAAFQRWMAFIPANIYSAISVCDFPARWVAGEEAVSSLGSHARERIKAYWKMVEDGVQPAPFLLGPTMTALDVYVAMITRWRPGRDWFRVACPKLMAAATRTEAHPVVAKVWARNFDR
jgi:GST-like protein